MEATLGVKRSLKKRARNINALFQHLRFHVCDLENIASARAHRRRGRLDGVHACTLALGVTGTVLQEDVLDRRISFKGRFFPVVYMMENEVAAVVRAVEIARACAAREGFEGFNIRELEAIAWGFNSRI